MTKWPKNCPTKNAFSLSGSITPPRKVITGTCGPVDFISEVKIELAHAESGEIDAAKSEGILMFHPIGYARSLG